MGRAPYELTRLGGVGAVSKAERLFRRTGLWIGGLLFAISTLYADEFVFSVEFLGSSVYARETYALLDAAGVRLFAPYRKGKEDWICAEILALDGVEYCSVQKRGTRLVVETRLTPFRQRAEKEGKMLSSREGTLISLCVLRGTPLVQVGERVTLLQPLVDDGFYTEQGERVDVTVVARASIACVWENVVAAETAEEAFAVAYLELLDEARIERKDVTAADGGFLVRIEYTATERWNF